MRSIHHYCQRMISAQRRMLTLLGFTFILATMMTISYYGGQPEITRPPATNRLVLSDIDKQNLIKLLNLVPYKPRGESDHHRPRVIVNDPRHTPSPRRKPFLPSNVIPSSTYASSTGSSYSPSSLQPQSSPPPPPPLSSSSLASSPSTSSSGSSLIYSASSSSASAAASSLIVTTLGQQHPSSRNSLDYHAANEVPSSPLVSPFPSSLFNRSSEGLNITKTIEERPTKPFFDQNEIATINNFTIDKPNFCDTDNGATLDLLVFVTSAVGNFQARQAIRSTWGQFAKERGAPLLFLIGNSRDPAIKDAINQEDEQYSDLIQGSYLDSYYNLTLKTMSMMRWISDNCDKVKFVLKVDDDMFLNMQMLVDFCETRTFSKSIIGHIAKKWKPHREPKSKWFVSESAYNRTVYPNFATGPCYLFSGDAARPLIEKSLKLKPFYLEDVFMTGIVAEAAGIRRLNYSLMKNVRVKVTSCNFKRFMTSHKHSPAEIVTLWNLVYDNIEKPCEKPTPSKPAKISPPKQPAKKIVAKSTKN